jgi:hypothetical protein
MGAACILNSRRCGRTHCRYTGPYYLAMIAPVLMLASGAISVDFYAWLSLAVLILGGSMIIWWATERAWGKFLRCTVAPISSGCPTAGACPPTLRPSARR